MFTGDCTVGLKEGVRRRLYCRTEGNCSQETTVGLKEGVRRRLYCRTEGRCSLETVL